MNRRTILKSLAATAAFWRTNLLGIPCSSAVPAVPVSDRVRERQPRVSGPRVIIPPPGTPRFEDYATVEAVVNGEPVYCLDYTMYIFGGNPDLMPGIVMQEGNTTPWLKLKPKKSWEIKHNLLGSNIEQHPRSPDNDLQPFLPIHLIDGDRDTVWSSFGAIAGPYNAPDAQPEWIRIDLPIEATVAAVALVCSSPECPLKPSFGRSLPKELTIKLSQDAWHWETVYDSKDVDVLTDRLEIKFEPRRAKQILVTGNYFTKPMAFGPPAFSIGEVEVLDPEGNNLALLSRGAGVTVSSTNYTIADNRLTANALWTPLHYDMGMKWLRTIGGGNGCYQWPFIEKTPGRYEIDPVLDERLADLGRCGVNLILGLDITIGNPIYRNPPEHINWQEARWRGLAPPSAVGGERPDTSNWVDRTPQMLAAWLRYVDFIVRHFRGRVFIYEIGNEWNTWGWNDQVAQQYMSVFEKTYEAVKNADPDARILLGSINLFAPDLLLTLMGQERKVGAWDGALVAHGGDPNDLARSTLVVAENFKAADVEVEVDALNRGTFGILLRYTSPQNFIVACYGTYMKDLPGYTPYMIFIAERAGDSWSTSQVSAKDVGGLNEKLHLSVRLSGADATLTISDGKRQETVTRVIKDRRLSGAGSVGLLQLTGANQRFDNFRASDLGSGTVLAEGFDGQNGKLPAGWAYGCGPNDRNLIKHGWASKVDGLGWHGPRSDRTYLTAIQDLKKQCQELGFKGRYYCTELVSAEDLASTIPALQTVMTHVGMDIMSATQITHFTGYAKNASNCRLTVASPVVTPVQPSVMYYMWRNLATVLDDFHPTEFPVRFSAENELLWFTFQRGGQEKMVAVWIYELGDANIFDVTLHVLGSTRSSRPPSTGEILETRVAMTLPGVRAKQAWVVDLMNGSEQQLKLNSSNAGTVIEGLRIKNYPVFIRFN